jgi:hypothetical protein
MSPATHANAALTPRARLNMIRLIVDHGWPSARAVERFMTSCQTAKKWRQAGPQHDEAPGVSGRQGHRGSGPRRRQSPALVARHPAAHSCAT